MATGGDSTDTAEFGDRTLDQNDVAGVVREIINVQTKSETLGRVLELSKGKVDSIHHQCSDSQKCLFGVIDEFVAQLEPRPTWRVILNALRNPLIGQTRLAEEIEKNHRQLPPAKNGIQYIPATAVYDLFSLHTVPTSMPQSKQSLLGPQIPAPVAAEPLHTPHTQNGTTDICYINLSSSHLLEQLMTAVSQLKEYPQSPQTPSTPESLCPEIPVTTQITDANQVKFYGMLLTMSASTKCV